MSSNERYHASTTMAAGMSSMSVDLLSLDPPEELLDATCLERRTSSMGTLTAWQHLAAQVSEEGDGTGAGSSGLQDSPLATTSSQRSLSWSSSANGRNGSMAPRPLAALYKEYRILECIGRGAYGNVSLAQRRSDRRQLVAKEVSLSQASMSTVKVRETILGEVEVLARLRHPNVVRFIEFFMDASSMLVIILEFCNAGDLAGLIKKRDGQLMSEATVMWLWVQIALALHYSHSNGVLHRDLKTSNVLCHNLARADAADACSTTTTTGPPPGPAAGLLLKLADFGVARCFDADSSLAGTVVGTPQYMSPELCAGEPGGRKSDIWGLGCILYELACLRKAFEASNIGGVIRKIVAGEYSPLPDGVFSAGLTQLVGSLLARHPTARPSAAEVLDMPYVRHHLACYLDWARGMPEAAPETLLATLSTGALPRSLQPAAAGTISTGSTPPHVPPASYPRQPSEAAAASPQAPVAEAAVAAPAAPTATDAAQAQPASTDAAQAQPASTDAAQAQPASKQPSPFASPAATLAAMASPPPVDDTHAASPTAAVVGGRRGLLGKKFKLATGGGSGSSSTSLDAWCIHTSHGSPQHSHDPQNSSGPLIAAFRGPDGGSSSSGGLSPLGSGSAEWRGSLPLELSRSQRSSSNGGTGSSGGGMPRSPLGRQMHSWVDDGDAPAGGQLPLRNGSGTVPAANWPDNTVGAAGNIAAVSLPVAAGVGAALAPLHDEGGGRGSSNGCLTDVLHALKLGSTPAASVAAAVSAAAAAPACQGGGSAPASFSCSFYNFDARLAHLGTQQQQPQAQLVGGAAAGRRSSAGLVDDKTSLQGWLPEDSSLLGLLQELREQAQTPRTSLASSHTDGCSVTLPNLQADRSMALPAFEGDSKPAVRKSWWLRTSSSTRGQAAAEDVRPPHAASGLSVAIPPDGDAEAWSASPAADSAAASSQALPQRPSCVHAPSSVSASEDCSDDDAPIDLAAMVKHCLSGNSFLFRHDGPCGASPATSPSAAVAAAAAAPAATTSAAAAAPPKEDSAQQPSQPDTTRAKQAPDWDEQLVHEQRQQLQGWRAYKARLQERHPHLKMQHV